MTLLRSKAPRVFYSNAGVLTDYTEAARTWADPAIAPTWIAATGAMYVGKTHAFSFLYFQMKTLNAKPTAMSVQHWNGKTWASVDELTDETEGFTASGFVAWSEQREWQKAKPASITGLESFASTQELFWIKITLSADPDEAMSIQAIKQLLSDDRYMRVVHPEIMNLLPSGQTNFLPQHELAMDLVSTDLIQAGTIAYFDQIKNPEDYLLASTYKCVDVILAPIEGDERVKEVRNRMIGNYKSCLRKSSASIDTNKNEVLDEKEKERGLVSHLTR